MHVAYGAVVYRLEKNAPFLKEVAGTTERNKSIDVINRYNYLMTNVNVVLLKRLAQAFLQGKQRVQGGLDKPVSSMYGCSHYNCE